VKRRDFIALLGGAAAWPVASARAQQQRMRRVGVLMNLTESDAEARPRAVAFTQSLEQLGWIAARNVQIDYQLVHKRKLYGPSGPSQRVTVTVPP
jgi:putative tryptophan/tyrosine transport system substrate-binding protein